MDVTRARFARSAPGGGGAGTSIDNNNVFTVQPNVYFEGMDPATEAASLYMDETKPKEVRRRTAHILSLVHGNMHCMPATPHAVVH